MDMVCFVRLKLYPSMEYRHGDEGNCLNSVTLLSLQFVLIDDVRSY